ncbi:Aminotransferase, class IV [Corchorus olitorius]|uniref:Aminotransferase, class IV n=1 Tax=Corchorus olitorius TaxID=93759 RepID=A0A1R3IES8_9ROSI|nr:Aminotransferase, class IV [Corchorus olitorius]
MLFKGFCCRMGIGVHDEGGDWSPEEMKKNREKMEEKGKLKKKNGVDGKRGSSGRHLSRVTARIRSLVNNSMNQVLPIALNERSDGQELAITALVSGDLEKLKEMKNVDNNGVLGVLDVHFHIGSYVPPVFGIEENGAHLALVGPGRDVAAAKYSDWVRLRKPLDKFRPPLVTELLLSNDGDRILEGCITNFFVICQRDKSEAQWNYLHDYDNAYPVEVQTAPITDGVLPGVIRQLVIEVCLSKGIPVREVAPSWEKHELWEEAFITNSLRVLQHVETIKVPRSWESLQSKCFEKISWMEKIFEGPGTITKVIQLFIFGPVDQLERFVIGFRPIMLLVTDKNYTYIWAIR